MTSIYDNTNIKIPAMQMTRTSGYYANVLNMNYGKQEEVKERKYLNVEQALVRRI